MDTSSKMDQYNDKRKASVEEKSELVLEVAKQLFLEKGLNDVSMSDIANAADMSRATMYRYFKNKEVIIFTLASRMMADIYETAFHHLSIDHEGDLALGYKNMVTMYDTLAPSYRYIAMFDARYTDSMPSNWISDIYKNQFNALILPSLGQLKEAAFNRHVMMINLTMDFLEDIALHENLIPETQNIPVKVLLHEFEKVIDAIISC